MNKFFAPQKKLLLVTEFYPSSKRLNFTGGVESFNYYLVEELSKKHQITVICRNDLRDAGEELRFKYKVIRVGSLAKKADSSLSTIPSRLSFFTQGIMVGLKEDFDVVQGTNFVTYLQAFILGFVKRRPTVAWYPDVFLGRWFKLVGFWSGAIGELTERLVIFLPWKSYIAMSKETKKRLEKVGVNQKKINVIYAGIDSSYYQKIKTEKEKVFTITCSCRLVSYKRVDLLIKASAILKEIGVKFKVVILGTGPETRNLRSLIKALKLTSQVEIISEASIEKRFKIIKSSQLFCLPSEVEGFGIVLIEAAACGVPLLLTDIPIFREVTRGGLGAIFFNKGDEDDLARKIVDYQKDAQLRREKVREVKKLPNFYRWSKISQEFESVYAKLR